MAHPRVIWLLNCFESLRGVSEMSLRIQGSHNDEWLAETKMNRSWDIKKAGHKVLDDFGMDTLRTIATSGVRTCVIAGGKMDQVDAVQEMGLVLKEEGKKHGVTNEAVVVRKAYYPWHLQLPALSARGIVA